MKNVLFVTGVEMIALMVGLGIYKGIASVVALGCIAAVVFLTVGGIAVLLDSEWWGRKRVKIAWTLRRMYMTERDQINNI